MNDHLWTISRGVLRKDRLEPARVLYKSVASNLQLPYDRNKDNFCTAIKKSRAQIWCFHQQRIVWFVGIWSPVHVVQAQQSSVMGRLLPVLLITTVHGLVLLKVTLTISLALGT